jgi:ATP-dependent Lhr-like helicase
LEISFHPLIRRWFSSRFESPTLPQDEGWRHITQGESTLIAAPTGSGKTLAAFLWSIDRLFRKAVEGSLEDRTSVVYVSPLKALGNDVERNLNVPLKEILLLAEAEGVKIPEIRVAVRTGDTPAKDRQAMAKRPPHILITTPESLYILLTAERSRAALRAAETVIVDEIHAVAGDKRGAHLALSLERLEALTEQPLQRIGLSATQKPIEEMARLLMGSERRREEGAPDCAVVDVGHQRDLDLRIEVPEVELGPIASQDHWKDVYRAIVERSKQNRTTLVFVNTRRLVERVAHQLTAELGEGKVGAHHGSLSRKARFEVEQKLKSGELPVVVATASLELGIDIGHVDLVCQIGAPRTLAVLLQRVGRSGHWRGAVSKGVLYPLTRDDLMQCAAAIRAVRAGELDRIVIPAKPLDILAQQIVALVASVTGKTGDSPSADSGIDEDDLFHLVRRAYPYRNLGREEFEQIIEILSEGISSRTGRRSAYLHRDRQRGRLRARRGARLSAITNGGAIPDTADYDVVELPHEGFVGKVNEDFAIESLAGDIFLLGNKSWRIRRVSSGKVWVEDAQGAPPSIPFWLGEAAARTPELSGALSELRREIARRLDDAQSAAQWLIEQTGVDGGGAGQMIAYVRETLAVIGAVPTTECLIAERFFDEAGGMQLVVHAPFGGRINRAFGLALRKRFCVTFDNEIQAAATDDGIVLSLGEQHSFPLRDVFSWLHPATLERDLVQAALISPMFTNRWRWNASRALALRRFSGGRKVPMAIQRFRAEDLLAAVFPEQTMCQDNRTGPVEIPDHPLVRETIDNCLHEAMDLDGLKAIVERIRSGELRATAVDTPAPSPMAHEILNANPYAFLDDAPLEERRARAVSLRRGNPDLASGLGALDPRAIEQVKEEAWPDLRDTDELHDFLLSACVLPEALAADWKEMAEQLVRDGRAIFAYRRRENGALERWGYVALDRFSTARALAPDLHVEGDFGVPSNPPAEEEAIRRTVQGWMEALGPTTASELAGTLGIEAEKAARGLLALEAQGLVLRGRFSQRNGSEEEWCDRVLLARIHRLTLGQLRSEIAAVSAADFIRFLFRWQHVHEDSRLRGREGLLEVISQLQGLELPAPAWEQSVLSGRIAEYDPADLEHLCLAGMVAWGRLRSDLQAPESADEQNPSKKRRRKNRSISRIAPIAFLLRDDLAHFVGPVDTSWRESGCLSTAARDVARCLETRGASFLADIARGTGLLKSRAEEALWELVARGLVSGDGIAGLRVLLTPEVKRKPARHRLRVLAGGRSPERLMPTGRWSLWAIHGQSVERDSAQQTEFLARQLLRRYGVVFRDLLAREPQMPSWRGLLEIYRRLEARGEIRGGRFVSGFLGEQYALPEAVDALRAVRRSHEEEEIVVVSSADPLNLVGILTPGPRVSPYSNQVIAYRGGVPVEIGSLGAVRSKLQQA